jgi:hypothetical protein
MKKLIEALQLIGILFVFTIVVPVAFAALIPLSILAMGVVTLLAGARTFQKGWQSYRWPNVPGRIVSCELAKWDSGAGRSRSVTYQPRLVYTYEVEGRAYTGSTLTALDSWSGKRWAERWMRRFPAGSDVAVTYSPKNPSEAFLVPGIDFWSVAIMLVGLGVIAISGYFYVMLAPQYPVVIAVREVVCVSAFAFWYRRRLKAAGPGEKK